MNTSAGTNYLSFSGDSSLSAITSIYSPLSGTRLSPPPTSEPVKEKSLDAEQLKDLATPNSLYSNSNSKQERKNRNRAAIARRESDSMMTAESASLKGNLPLRPLPAGTNEATNALVMS